MTYYVIYDSKRYMIVETVQSSYFFSGSLEDCQNWILNNG